MKIGDKVKFNCGCSDDKVGTILRFSDGQAFVKWILTNGKEYYSASDIKNLEIINDSYN